MGSGPSSGFSRPPSGPSASSRGRAVHRDATPRRDDHIAAKRTLTDFRIVGVECTELAWSWGKLGLAGVHDVVHDLPTKESSKTPQAENGVEATSGESTAVKQEAVSPPKATPVALPSIPKSLLAAHQSETSRIRFYFQSPIELEDVRPGRVWGGGGVGGKRKKEYEEGEGDGQENGKRIKEYDENEGSVVSLTESMLDPSAPMSAPPNDKVDIPASSDEPLAVIKAEGASAGDVRSPREEFDGPDDEVDPASLQRPHSAPETLLPGRFAHSSTDPSYSYDTEDEESGAFSAPNASQSDLEVVLAEVDGDVADRPASESRIPTTPPSDRLVSIALAEDPDVSDACPSRDEEVAVFPPAHSLKSESDTQAAIETTQADAERPAPDDTTSEAPAPVPEAHGEAAVPKPDLAEPDRAPAPAQEPTVPLTSASPDQPSSLAIFPSTLPLVPNTTVLAEDDQDRPSARSPDRISISYAGSSRRLVLDADIVEKVKIWRGNGRIELTVMVQNETYELEARDVLVDGGDDGKSDAVGGDETGKDVPGVAESLPVMDRTEDETKPVNGENGLTGDSGAVDEKPKLSEGNAEAAVEETVKEHITPGLLASRCRGILASLLPPYCRPPCSALTGSSVAGMIRANIFHLIYFVFISCPGFNVAPALSFFRS